MSGLRKGLCNSTIFCVNNLYYGDANLRVVANLATEKLFGLLCITAALLHPSSPRNAIKPTVHLTLWDRPSEKEKYGTFTHSVLLWKKLIETGEGCCSTWIIQVCIVSLFLVEAVLLGSVSCGKFCSPVTPLPTVNIAFAAWLLDASSTLSAAVLRPAVQAEHLQF